MANLPKRANCRRSRDRWWPLAGFVEPDAGRNPSALMHAECLETSCDTTDAGCGDSVRIPALRQLSDHPEHHQSLPPESDY
jgi:hypothetical protein